MHEASSYYSVVAVAIAVVIAAYWARPGRRALVLSRPRNLLGLLALIGAGIGLSLWSVALQRSAFTFERQSDPIAIAIAFDLSPSMLAIPHPQLDSEYLPRFERGKSVLLEYFRELEAQGEPIIVSVVGFTREADIIMGWDQSTAQVTEILDYAVSPDLFGSSGTSIEAATTSLERIFSMLPAAVRKTSRQLAIVVSDGEDTMRASSIDYAKQELAASDFDTIALQTGLIDTDEGVPIYGRAGEFTGFRRMGGETYTVPNFATMGMIAESSGGRGLHIHAEAPTAVEHMLQFTLGDDRRHTALDATLLSTFGMFAVVSMLCAAILR